MTEVPEEFIYQGYIRRQVVKLLKTVVVSVPGSGKTRPTVEALVELGRIYPPGPTLTPHGPILVVCTGPAIATWRRQLPGWSQCPELEQEIHIVRGPKHKRVQLWTQAEQSNGGIYITNYSIFLRDYAYILAARWSTMIADEYHRCMRRKKKNRTYAAFLSLSRKVEVVILLTGSLMRKNPASMFTAFQIIKPKLFRGYWKFVNTFCIVTEGHFGKQIEGVRNVKALQEIMDRYMAYIPKEAVVDQLPDGRRMTMYAEMTQEQAKIYKDLTEDMISELKDSILVTPNVLTRLIRLRQLLCCPRILDPSLGMGGGFDLILDKLQDQSHAVIFVPFRPACEFIPDELRRRGYKNVYMIRGGISPDQQDEQVNAFRETRGILVCTISYAESFDLETCDTSHFLGYDYSLDVNEQAEGRTTRAISEFEYVTWNYVKYLGTHDEDFLQELGTDMHNVRRVMQRPESLINALRGITHD